MVFPAWLCFCPNPFIFAVHKKPHNPVFPLPTPELLLHQAFGEPCSRRKGAPVGFVMPMQWNDQADARASSLVFEILHLPPTSPRAIHFVYYGLGLCVFILSNIFWPRRPYSCLQTFSNSMSSSLTIRLLQKPWATVRTSGGGFLMRLYTLIYILYHLSRCCMFC